MFRNYLVTGASGFLGRTVLAELKEKGACVRALVMENDPLAVNLPDWVSVVYGDVCDEASLNRFFSGADSQTCVIHCAGIVSVASHPGDRIYRVNVGGTNNILRHCEKAGVGKLIHVSSVHAIPEKPKGTEITEDAVFSPELVRGVMTAIETDNSSVCAFTVTDGATVAVIINASPKADAVLDLAAMGLEQGSLLGCAGMTAQKLEDTGSMPPVSCLVLRIGSRQ